MVSFNDLKVALYCGGKKCTEYKDDEASDQSSLTKTTYVEVRSNETWHLKISTDEEFDWQGSDRVAARICVDGRRVKKHTLSESTRPGLSAVAVVRGKSSGDDKDAKFLRFRFADLETRDMNADDDPSQFKKLYQDLGTIRVDVDREILTGTTKPGEHKPARRPSLQSIPEKGLKGRPLHVASTYDIEPRAPRSLQSSRNVYRRLNQGAVFILKYRTRHALQSLMIIDRSPSPLPLSERAIEELTREELMRLEQQRRDEEEMERQKIKREREEPHSPILRPLKTSRGVKGQIIYHLDSDSDDEETSHPPQHDNSPSAASSELEASQHSEDEVEVITLL